MKDFLIRMGTLDRRWIFLMIALAVIVPLMLEMRTTMPTSTIVQNLFDKIESLEPGDTVLLSLDFGPGTAPENQPMADAVTRHCMERGVKVIYMTLWATGTPQIELSMNNVFEGDLASNTGKTYGVDYVNLGYKAGNQGVINSIVGSFGFFSADAREGKTLAEHPIMSGINNLADVALVVGIGSGKPGLKEWVQFGGDQADVPVGGGVTAVEAPLMYPYYPHQLLGLMGGLQGAAEYETALLATYPRYVDMELSVTSAATNFMGPQTVAHIVIVLLVILGNLSVLAARGRRKA